MSRSHKHSPSFNRTFDREGFEPLNNKGDATIDIPLEQVPTKEGPSAASPAQVKASNGMSSNEKSGFLHRHGPRRPVSSRGPGGFGHAKTGYDGEEDTITSMGRVYHKFLNFSVITRYLTYIVPLGILLSVPIVIGATAAPDAEIGGVHMTWFFVWLLVSWVGLWGSKIVAHFLPVIFQAIVGVVSSGVRKYALLIKALEIPLSLVGWALVTLATFKPLMTGNPQDRHDKGANPDWIDIVQQILAAAMISSLIFLAERFFIQLITINYHRKQFTAKIKESKHSIYLLGLLYEASRAMFPAFCPEFQDEDAIIADTLDVSLGGKNKKKTRRSGSATPMRILRDVGRLGDKVTAAFGSVAHEVTGKDVFNPNSSHSVVVTALEKNKSSEALARRLWLSFVIEGNDALFYEDVQEVLGAERQHEAEEAFNALDRDANGDISLDEMILTVAQFGRDRHAIHNSLHDVDQAINVLDQMLCVIVFIIVVFIFIAFLNHSFVTTLATTGTALISLSFIFSVSAQEVLGSCIFLFVKHPYDIGDRVDLNMGNDQMLVEHISLLFTVFRRVSNHRLVQVPNVVMNTLWVENVTRSKAMKEQLSIFVSFDTTMEDIQLLKNEMEKFVTNKDNSRDFQPEVDLEVIGIHEMDKLELMIEISHKSNWANETVRAARRSKFICALVLAFRKVPIYGPGGGDPALGAAGNPSYSVAVSNAEAKEQRDSAAKDKEAKRLVPTKAPESATVENLGSASEMNGMNLLNDRDPAADGVRDAGSLRGNTSPPTSFKPKESMEIQEVRGILRRETTKGRRKSDRTANSMDIGMSTAVPQIGVTPSSPSVQQYTTQQYSTQEYPGPTSQPSQSQQNWFEDRSDDEYERAENYNDFPPPPMPSAAARSGPSPSNAQYPRPY